MYAKVPLYFWAPLYLLSSSFWIFYLSHLIQWIFTKIRPARSRLYQRIFEFFLRVRWEGAFNSQFLKEKRQNSKKRKREKNLNENCKNRERYYQKTIPAIPASPRGAQLVSVLSGLQAQKTLYHVKPPNCQEAAPYRSCSLAHNEFSGNQTSRHLPWSGDSKQSGREARARRIGKPVIPWVGHEVKHTKRRNLVCCPIAKQAWSVRVIS